MENIIEKKEEEEPETEIPMTYSDIVLYFWKRITYIFQTLFPPNVIRVMTVYFMWILLHYISSHLYTIWCTPWSLSGFILSTILVPSPHCEGLRWAIYYGATKINTMWILLGGYIIHFIEKICLTQ